MMDKLKIVVYGDHGPATVIFDDYEIEVKREDGKRIVSCVNALEGIDDVEGWMKRAKWLMEKNDVDLRLADPERTR